MAFSRKWILFLVGILAGIHITLGVIGPVLAFTENFLTPYAFISLIVENLLVIVGYFLAVNQCEN